MNVALKPLEHLTNEEIKDEYAARFGAPSLDDYESDSLRDELESRGEEPEVEQPEGLGEIFDHLAEAARTSSHAERAYSLLRELFPDASQSLAGQQMLIFGRMGGVA